jgi:uncharacterized membrane protein (UPF0182 family)
VRRPSDIPPPPPRSRSPRRRTHRLRFWLIIAVVVIIVLLASLRTLATFYTNFLWFESVQQSGVWKTELAVKVGLFLVFAAIFFVVLWVNLAIVDRVTAPSLLTLGPEDELVRRYQHVIAPRAFLIRTLVSLVIALIAASSTIGEWQNYLLYIHGGNFGVKDPEFGRDIGFFVFKLPFIQFVIGWCFASLVVITIITAAAHYLNGGIRPQGRAPKVAPQVKVHLSVLVAVIAVVKAVGYYYQRFSLDLSANGYVQGAGYTDVHARLPALSLLFWISLLAGVILLINIRNQGWLLPVIAIGLWAFVAVVVGAIYPAIVQALKVSPAQSKLELPYIARNIAATRAAYNLTTSNVTTNSYSGTAQLTPAEEQQNATTFNDIRLWDPDPSLTGNTYSKLQQQRAYYQFTTQALDRYYLNGGSTPTPAIVAVRQVNSSNLPAQGWVNDHLVYTHGYGMIVSPANTATGSGQPVFNVQDVPEQTVNQGPVINQPDVYFGYNNPGYVIADTAEPEVDYQSNGSNVTSSYSGPGGVQLNSFLKRAAFAVRFGDLNILISNLITPKSRMMFMQDIQTDVNTVAPFLSLDSDPYPVIVDGQIDWVQDAYTTTSNYPYSQDADTSAVSSNSSLSGATFNYIRNSVKVVVNAYTGKMTLYVMDPTDPIIKAWMSAFPNLFTPATSMPQELQNHLRYPEDVFTVQATMLGKYHITNTSVFYNAGDAWSLSQSAGSGSPTAALQNTVTTNAQGQQVSGQIVRMSPIYQEMEIPGQQNVSFNIMDAYVPVSQNDSVQTLAGFIFGDCDFGKNYGKLTVFQTPPSESIDGPALVDARILANQAVSRQITLLDQGGSSVVLGNLLVVPVDKSILYFRPLYVQGRNAYPQLTDVIAVEGGQGNSQVYMESTLQAALDDVFGKSSSSSSSSGPSPPSSTSVNSTVQNLINQEYLLDAQIEADLKASTLNLGQFQTDVTKLVQIGQEIYADTHKATKTKKQTPPASKLNTTSTTLAVPTTTVPGTEPGTTTPGTTPATTTPTSDVADATNAPTSTTDRKA